VVRSASEIAEVPPSQRPPAALQSRGNLRPCGNLQKVPSRPEAAPTGTLRDVHGIAFAPDIRTDLRCRGGS